MTLDKICQSCGQGGAKECGQCHRVAYCDRNCQRKDWKEHRPFCFPVGAKCRRCLEKIDTTIISQCSVPHPEHLVRSSSQYSCKTSSSGPNGSATTRSVFCMACEKTFNLSNALITDGPKLCYCGPHTIKPLKSSDLRKNGLKENERIDVYYGRTDGTIGYKEYSCVVVLTTEKDDLRYFSDLYEGADSDYKVLYEVPMGELGGICAEEPSIAKPSGKGFVGPELKERVLAYWKQHK